MHTRSVRIVVSLVFLVVLPALTTSQAREGEAADAIVRVTLARYSAAFENLDAAAVKKVQPSIDLENLKSVFKELRALQVSIDEIRILSSETRAIRVSCRVTQTLTPRAGSKQTMTVARVIRLHQVGDAWVVGAFER